MAGGASGAVNTPSLRKTRKAIMLGFEMIGLVLKKRVLSLGKRPPKSVSTGVRSNDTSVAHVDEQFTRQNVEAFPGHGLKPGDLGLTVLQLRVGERLDPRLASPSLMYAVRFSEMNR